MSIGNLQIVSVSTVYLDRCQCFEIIYRSGKPARYMQLAFAVPTVLLNCIWVFNVRYLNSKVTEK